MNPNSSKKLLTVMVTLLLLANAATLTLFWFKYDKPEIPLKGGPAKFVIKELGFDQIQQERYMVLADEHQRAVGPIREKIKVAKDHFFELLSQPQMNDSTRRAAAQAISINTEELDLLTFDHFAKVRALCSQEQQKKFDAIIKNVIRMMGMPHPSGPPMHGPEE